MILLFILLLAGCQYVGEYIPIETPVSEVQEVVEEIPEIQEPKFDKLQWGHLPVTYFITNEDECGSYESRRINRAFEEVTTSTDGIVTFKKIEEDADINVTCTFIKDCYKKWTDVRREENIVYRYESICQHTKGLAGIRETNNNEIKKAEIFLIGLDGFVETTNRGASGYYVGSCGHITTEIHEILHTFNYKHEQSPLSIMYYATELVGFTIQNEGSCIGSKRDIDIRIRDQLKKDYKDIST